jgi:hypothetical protein
VAPYHGLGARRAKLRMAVTLAEIDRHPHAAGSRDSVQSRTESEAMRGDVKLLDRGKRRGRSLPESHPPGLDRQAFEFPVKDGDAQPSSTIARAMRFTRDEVEQISI